MIPDPDLFDRQPFSNEHAEALHRVEVARNDPDLSITRARETLKWKATAALRQELNLPKLAIEEKNDANQRS